MNITKRRVAFVAALIVSVLAIVTVCGLAGCSSCSRSVKSVSSDFSGGINRTVTLYDNTGKASSTLNRTTKRFSLTMPKASA